MIFDYTDLKKYIEDSGLKQKVIAEKSGISKERLCMILQGKRKCEVGEYASICDAIGVNLERFIHREQKTARSAIPNS